MRGLVRDASRASLYGISSFVSGQTSPRGLCSVSSRLATRLWVLCGFRCGPLPGALLQVVADLFHLGFQILQATGLFRQTLAIVLSAVVGCLSLLKQVANFREENYLAA